MYDIMIQKNGGLYLLDGDLKSASYERFIAQKIYAAVMEIPPDLLGGRSSTSAETMKKVLQQYFNDKFSGDPDINPKDVICLIDENTTRSEFITFNLTYSGRSPEGRSITFNSDFNFNLESGALAGVEYSISFPSINLGDPYEVEEYLNITSMTQEVELPVTPMLSPDMESVYSPIMLIPSSMSGEIGDLEMNYSIATDGKRKTYQIDNYISGFDTTRHTVKSVNSIYSVSGEMDYTIFEKYGKYIIRTSDTGLLMGAVDVVTAKYLTYDILYSDTYINQEVFRLKPASGKCIAVFPGTITPGNYILKYTGVTQP